MALSRTRDKANLLGNVQDGLEGLEARLGKCY